MSAEKQDGQREELGEKLPEGKENEEEAATAPRLRITYDLAPERFRSVWWHVPARAHRLTIGQLRGADSTGGIAAWRRSVGTSREEPIPARVDASRGMEPARPRAEVSDIGSSNLKLMVVGILEVDRRADFVVVELEGNAASREVTLRPFKCDAPTLHVARRERHVVNAFELKHPASVPERVTERRHSCRLFKALLF